MIELEDFFRKPDKVQLRLSPDGAFLAYLEPYQRRLNVTVRDLATGETRRVTDATERDVAGIAWANDDRLIYVLDKGGDENFRLYVVGRDGSNPLDLTPFDDVKCGIIDDLEEVPDEVLIQMNKRNKEIFDAYRVNVQTGELRIVAENPGNVQSWQTDHDGKLRLATTTDGVNSSLLYRETEDDPFRSIATYDFKESVQPRVFTPDNRALYVSSNVDRDKAAIFEFDPDTAEHTRLIFEHDEVDVAEVLYSRKRKLMTGVAYDSDRLHYHFFDEQRQKLQEFLDRERPGYEHHLVSSSRDEKIAVVYSGSDRHMGSYSLLDTEKMQLTPLFDISPWLAESEMAEMRPISYTTRDGLKVRGYLTLPPGPPGKNHRDLPMVVNPHGGPWARDSWGFNPEIQFLANRGYAVLQMNFRGSTGFGREFWEKSFGQWGLKMQDDVADAVQWAIDEGVADPARIAIYGGSYGGYATLSGLTRHPELYACGISYVGVSNLFTWIEAIPPYWKMYLDMLHEMVGHPEHDAERFRETSPFFHADKIRAPLFVAQGANDPRVTQQESDQIVEALRQRGVQVDYMVKDNEGHGFHNEENRFDFYRALEVFLARHLQVGAPA